MREFLAATVDTAQDLVLEVDGRPALNVYRLRVPGAVGACRLPDDNIFRVPFDAVPHECVVDAYWAPVPPLSAGDHTIRFAGGSASSGVSLDVTYEIIVRGR